MKYVEISKTDVPGDIQFDVTGRNQGQIVEVAYGGRDPHPRGEYSAGEPFKRVIDTSEGRTPTYYRLEGVQG